MNKPPDTASTGDALEFACCRGVPRRNPSPHQGLGNGGDSVGLAY